MPYNHDLADRVRRNLAGHPGMVEKRMFGGLGFMLHGNMCVGVWREFLIARIGVDEEQRALATPYAREFDITGKVMRGWVMVELDGLMNDEQIRSWTDLAIKFVETLPTKT